MDGSGVRHVPLPPLLLASVGAVGGDGRRVVRRAEKNHMSSEQAHGCCCPRMIEEEPVKLVSSEVSAVAWTVGFVSNHSLANGHYTPPLSKLVGYEL